MNRSPRIFMDTDHLLDSNLSSKTSSIKTKPVPSITIAENAELNINNYDHYNLANTYNSGNNLNNSALNSNTNSPMSSIVSSKLFNRKFFNSSMKIDTSSKSLKFKYRHSDLNGTTIQPIKSSDSKLNTPSNISNISRQSSTTFFPFEKNSSNPIIVNNSNKISLHSNTPHNNSMKNISSTKSRDNNEIPQETDLLISENNANEDFETNNFPTDNDLLKNNKKNSVLSLYSNNSLMLTPLPNNLQPKSLLPSYLYWLEKIYLYIDYAQIMGILWIAGQNFKMSSQFLEVFKFFIFFNLDFFSNTEYGALNSRDGLKYIKSRWGEMDGYLDYVSIFIIASYIIFLLSYVASIEKFIYDFYFKNYFKYNLNKKEKEKKSKFVQWCYSIIYPDSFYFSCLNNFFSSPLTHSPPFSIYHSSRSYYIPQDYDENIEGSHNNKINTTLRLYYLKYLGSYNIKKYIKYFTNTGIILTELLILPIFLAVFRLYRCDSNKDDFTIESNTGYHLSCDKSVVCYDTNHYIYIIIGTLGLFLMVYSYLKILLNSYKFNVYYRNPKDHEKRLQTWELAYILNIDSYYVDGDVWLCASFTRCGIYFRLFMNILKILLLVYFIFIRFNIVLQSFFMLFSIILFTLWCGLFVGLFEYPLPSTLLRFLSVKKTYNFIKYYIFLCFKYLGIKNFCCNTICCNKFKLSKVDKLTQELDDSSEYKEKSRWIFCFRLLPLNKINLFQYPFRSNSSNYICLIILIIHSINYTFALSNATKTFNFLTVSSTEYLILSAINGFAHFLIIFVVLYSLIYEGNFVRVIEKNPNLLLDPLNFENNFSKAIILKNWSENSNSQNYCCFGDVYCNKEDIEGSTNYKTCLCNTCYLDYSNDPIITSRFLPWPSLQTLERICIRRESEFNDESFKDLFKNHEMFINSRFNLNSIYKTIETPTTNVVSKWIETIQNAMNIAKNFIILSASSSSDLEASASLADVDSLESIINRLKMCYNQALSVNSIVSILLADTLESLIVIHRSACSEHQVFIKPTKSETSQFPYDHVDKATCDKIKANLYTEVNESAATNMSSPTSSTKFIFNLTSENKPVLKIKPSASRYKQVWNEEYNQITKPNKYYLNNHFKDSYWKNSLMNPKKRRILIKLLAVQTFLSFLPNGQTNFKYFQSILRVKEKFPNDYETGLVTSRTNQSTNSVINNEELDSFFETVNQAFNSLILSSNEPDDENNEYDGAEFNHKKIFSNKHVSEARKMIRKLKKRTEFTLNRHSKATKKINEEKIIDNLDKNSSAKSIHKVNTMELIKATADEDEQKDLEILYKLWDNAISLFENNLFPCFEWEYEALYHGGEIDKKILSNKKIKYFLHKDVENWYAYRGLVWQRMHIVTQLIIEKAKENDMLNELIDEEVDEEEYYSDEENNKISNIAPFTSSFLLKSSLVNTNNNEDYIDENNFFNQNHNSLA